MCNCLFSHPMRNWFFSHLTCSWFFSHPIYTWFFHTQCATGSFHTQCAAGSFDTQCATGPFHPQRTNGSYLFVVVVVIVFCLFGFCCYTHHWVPTSLTRLKGTWSTSNLFLYSRRLNWLQSSRKTPGFDRGCIQQVGLARSDITWR